MSWLGIRMSRVDSLTQHLLGTARATHAARRVVAAASQRHGPPLSQTTTTPPRLPLGCPLCTQGERLGQGLRVGHRRLLAEGGLAFAVAQAVAFAITFPQAVAVAVAVPVTQPVAVAVPVTQAVAIAITIA